MARGRDSGTPAAGGSALTGAAMTPLPRPYESVPGADRPRGVAPAILLVDPRFARNVGVAVRAASCYGLSQVWFTGQRFDLAGRSRLPREERMKGYRTVEVVHCERPFEQLPAGTLPIAVEVRPGATPLFELEHPEQALCVFGPEDGSIPGRPCGTATGRS